jgi:hypothetical protein
METEKIPVKNVEEMKKPAGFDREEIKKMVEKEYGRGN